MERIFMLQERTGKSHIKQNPTEYQISQGKLKSVQPEMIYFKLLKEITNNLD
jgi:hypothetical protein